MATSSCRAEPRPGRRGNGATALLLVLAAVLAAPPVLAGRADWPMRYHDPAHTGVAGSGPARKPAVAWSLALRGNYRYPPVVAGGTVYVTDLDRVVAVDLASGRVRWDKQFDNFLTSGPAVAGSRLLVAERRNLIRGVHRDSGERAWTVATDYYARSEAVVAGNRVFLESTGPGPPHIPSYLFAIDARKGKRLWVAEYFQGAMAPPASGGGSVYLATRTALRAYDARTGDERWTFEHRLSSATAPSLDGERVYFAAHAASGLARVHALDRRNGAKLWERSFETRAAIDTPAVLPERLLVAVTDVGLHALDPRTGKDLWLAPDAGLLETQPAVGKDAAYFLVDERLRACRLSDGTPLWSFDLNGRGAYVVAAGDTLVVSAWGGALLALR